MAAKIINADQKTQVLKKPGLQAQLAQLEEQLAQYKKIDQEYRARVTTEKAELEKKLTEKLEKEKADAVAEIKEKAEADINKSIHDSLLVLSQFLRLAAARRAEDADAGLDENLALEGVLLNVYSGDENAVATMVKLVKGAEEPTRSTAGEPLETTCMFPTSISCHPPSISANLHFRCAGKGRGCGPRSSSLPNGVVHPIRRIRGRRVQGATQHGSDHRACRSDRDRPGRYRHPHQRPRNRTRSGDHPYRKRWHG